MRKKTDLCQGRGSLQKNRALFQTRKMLKKRLFFRNDRCKERKQMKLLRRKYLYIYNKKKERKTKKKEGGAFEIECNEGY